MGFVHLVLVLLLGCARGAELRSGSGVDDTRLASASQLALQQTQAAASTSHRSCLDCDQLMPGCEIAGSVSRFQSYAFTGTFTPRPIPPLAPAVRAISLPNPAGSSAPRPARREACAAPCTALALDLPWHC